ncbi:MAG: Hsp20/alpha crystallin family protein [Maribacter sp.]|uniref:Hsp20/alpha crystallin family protein n=1 Tax=Maribacter sp. TaxID=1897614 RepID=UPI003C790CF2
MSLIKRNDVLFPALMNEIFKPDWFGGMENYNTNVPVPAVNIKENEKDFELELAVPGRKKEDFQIEVNENVLTISSETKSEENVDNENFTRREFSYTSFKRAFTLPETIDEEHIKATYEDGILTFNLPKKEEALPKPKRLIKLS